MLPLAINYEVTLFGIDLKFSDVAFTIPIGSGWDIYWYGICISLGFLLAVIYCYNRAKKFDINLDNLTDVVLVTTPVAILCARLYYIIFYTGNLKINSIGDFFGFSGKSGISGLAIYGGVIGAALCGFLMCKIKKVNILDAFDLAASGFLIGQAIGRWGNFFNQEAYGSYTNSEFWGMTNQYIDGNVHPCFLYESVWCILGFVLLHFLGNKRKFKGQLCLTYGVWYGFGRMIIEGLRTDSLYIGPLRVSQWLSAALLVVCGGLIIYNLRKLKTKVDDKNYVPMFDEIDPSYVKGVSYYEGDEIVEEATNEATETEEIDETQENMIEETAEDTKEEE
jgi:phosphatidylglycerol:prolipoprotein diacylglycerol transferase